MCDYEDYIFGSTLYAPPTDNKHMLPHHIVLHHPAVLPPTLYSAAPMLLTSCPLNILLPQSLSSDLTSTLAEVPPLMMLRGTHLGSWGG